MGHKDVQTTDESYENVAVSKYLERVTNNCIKCMLMIKLTVVNAATTQFAVLYVSFLNINITEPSLFLPIFTGKLSCSPLWRKKHAHSHSLSL